MLSTHLLGRSDGSQHPSVVSQAQTARLVHALQPAPHVTFDGYASKAAEAEDDEDGHRHPRANAREDGRQVYAHRTGVNAIAIEKLDGRYLLSGGADAAISLWDLEAAELDSSQTGAVPHVPHGRVTKASSHRFGITMLSWYPFDSEAFLSTSFDHTLKLYSTATLAQSASFDLGSVVYAHALSPIAQHLLVACATQHPAVRLVDLRSGAATHSLVGHGGGAVMSVAWSPRDEHVLASGGADGVVRFWDVRRSAGSLGVLDLEDSVGIVGYDRLGLGARGRERGRAHAGPVNGIVWTEDGRWVVTAGHDERVRVWSCATGANTLANFGPAIRNRHASPLLPCVVPRGYMPTKQDILLFPNEREILMLELFEGRLLKRLKAPGIAAASAAATAGQRNIQSRVACLAWRSHDVELLSAHADGTIRSWRPHTSEDALVEDDEQAEGKQWESEDGRLKRKRNVLDEIYRDLTTPKVTFS